MKKTVLALLSLSAGLSVAWAAPRYGFRHYSVKDGLSSNTVRALIQDRQGLVWFGTGAGLQSFDGREMIAHPLPGGSDDVNCLLEASDGTLWAGTDDALFCAGEDARFHRVDLDGLPRNPVAALAEDREGNIWAGFLGGGVVRLKDGVAAGFLPGQDVECLFVDRSDRVWACSQTSADLVYTFSRTAEAFTPYRFNCDGCSLSRVCAMTEDQEGNLWLGTWDSGLYLYDIQDLTLRVAASGKGFSHIHSLTEIAPRTFLVGSDEGLLWLNTVTGERLLYGNDRSDPLSLSNRFVYPVVVDHEGGLWVGTYNGGVNYAVPGFGQFDAVSVSSLTGTQEEYTVSCFCEDPDGTLWVGSDNGGLFRLDPQRRRATAPLPSRNVQALCREGDNLWIGSYSGGVDRMDVRTGRVRTYQDLDNSSIYAVAHLRDTLWVGSMLGISRYDASSDRFVLEKEVGGVTASMVPDEQGNLWCATSGKGLLVRTPGGEWKQLSGASSGLPSDVVNSLFPAHGGLYAGTKAGLVFISDSLEVTSILPDTDICAVVSDGSMLWLSTAKGLLRCPLGGGTVERYGENDGVLTGPFVPSAGLVTRDGRILFGATDGFLAFYPGKVVINRVPPTVLIPRFLAYPGNGGEEENVLQTQGTDDIRLPWRLRNVRFSFAALSYCAPEKNRFSYILEGYDKVWRDSGGLNWAEYDRLPAGRYRFRVVASNNDGFWNREGAELSFTIRPHILLSRWAVILYFLLFGLGVFLLLRALVRRSERRYREQYDELKTPIARITAPLERIRSHRADLPDELRKDLDVIDRNSRRLVTMVNQLQGEKIPQPAPAADEATEEGDFITRLNAVIRDNLSNADLSVAMLASEMAVSRSGLFTKVKAATGETPNSLIVRTRLRAAADLLAKGKNSVGEVCYMVGFSSPSYFSKSFVKEYGVTPMEWTRSHRT